MIRSALARILHRLLPEVSGVEEVKAMGEAAKTAGENLDRAIDKLEEGGGHTHEYGWPTPPSITIERACYLYVEVGPGQVFELPMNKGHKIHFSVDRSTMFDSSCVHWCDRPED